MNFHSIYIAFDPHPSSKGASTHITHFYNALRQAQGPAALLTVEGHDAIAPDLAACYRGFSSEEPNYLRRGGEFSQWVDGFLDEHSSITFAHFRDIWGGLSVLKRPHIRSVYEVNGLPSIELPYRYPQIAPITLEKLRKLEYHCLYYAHALVVPSETIRTHLLGRGISADKITVIPNGAEVAPSYPRAAEQPDPYLLYQGALQPWQGVDVLLKAFRYLEDFESLRLVICCGHKPKYAKPLRRIAHRLGLQDHIDWYYQLPKPHLQQLMQHAVCTVAPLIECSRNLEQGCSPLKILESMACGTPVVASDMPVVRELIAHEGEGLLCKPGRAADLARQLRLLLEYPEWRDQLGKAAQNRIQELYTWQHQKEKLLTLYRHQGAEIYSL